MWCLERMNTCSTWVIMPKAHVREVVYGCWIRPAMFIYTASSLKIKIGLTAKSPLLLRLPDCKQIPEYAVPLRWLMPRCCTERNYSFKCYHVYKNKQSHTMWQNVNRAFLRKAIYLPPWFIIQWHVSYFFFVIGTHVHNNKVLDLKVFDQPFQSAM